MLEAEVLEGVPDAGRVPGAVVDHADHGGESTDGPRPSVRRNRLSGRGRAAGGAE
jgi:hypothetical protein